MRVAVVGNGTSLLRLKKGEEIDSHDIIIRINEYYKFMDSTITGNRTTYWANSFPTYNWIDPKNYIGIWLTRQEDWDLQPNDNWKIPEWAKEKIVLERPDQLLYELEILFNKLGGRCAPTTGDATIDTARRKYRNDTINLYGFDFYEPCGHYYNTDKNNIAGTPRTHNATASKMYTLQLVAENKNINIIRENNEA